MSSISHSILFATKFLLALALTTSAYSQVKVESGAGSSISGVQNQDDNAVDTFLNVKVQIKKIIRMPDSGGALRVVFQVIESDDQGRRITLISPKAALTDDVGNVYFLSASTGISACADRSGTMYDLRYCYQRSSNTPVKLTPSQPLTSVMTFSPADDGNFSQDLADIAETATLQARFGLFSDDFSKQDFADVVINGIQLPKN